jgi:glycosyltransferase 2 family protein
MKFGWKGALGVVIAAACLYFAFRNFDWGTAWKLAANANYGLLLLSAAAATGMYPLRARRWRVILDPVAPRLPLGALWRAVAIGQMATNFIPRAGELVRPYALSREIPAVPFSMSFASVAVDRVFDAVVVLLLLGVSILNPGLPPTITVMDRTMTIAQLAWGFAALPLTMLVVLYGLVFFPNALIRAFELFARRVSSRLEATGGEMLRRFAEGLSVLRNPRHFFSVFMWTLAHWLLQPLAFWLGLKAFGIEVPWAATLFVQGVIVAAVAILPSPGFVGVFEGAAGAALGAYGVSATLGVTWATVFHIISFIPITVIGAYYFIRAGIHMGDVDTAAQDTAPA